jgi:crotonobetainyl-CoA:carnitine CoA-transferase CaiB-like acyl-CoA transferase
VFVELAKHADIVIENLRPGTMASWGVGYEGVRAVNAAIVYVLASASSGRFPGGSRTIRLRRAIPDSRRSMASPTARRSRLRPFWLDDLGGVHAALGALAALRHRDQTGEGQHVDIALVDTLLFQSNGNLTAGAMGLAVPRLGNEYAVSAPTNMYRCSDGWVYAGVLMDVHWHRLAQAIGGAELANDPRYAALTARLEHRDEVDALLAEWCSTRSVAEITAAFENLGLPATRVNSYAEAARTARGGAGHAAAHLSARRQRSAAGRTCGEVLPHAAAGAHCHRGTRCVDGRYPARSRLRRRRHRATARR